LTTQCRNRKKCWCSGDKSDAYKAYC